MIHNGNAKNPLKGDGAMLDSTVRNEVGKLAAQDMKHGEYTKLYSLLLPLLDSDKAAGTIIMRAAWQHSRELVLVERTLTDEALFEEQIEACCQAVQKAAKSTEEAKSCLEAFGIANVDKAKHLKSWDSKADRMNVYHDITTGFTLLRKILLRTLV
eukprot:Clim_evm64s157 gene=Clim_evmTU64s157